MLMKGVCLFQASAAPAPAPGAAPGYSSADANGNMSCAPNGSDNQLGLQIWWAGLLLPQTLHADCQCMQRRAVGFDHAGGLNDWVLAVRTASS
jgi:hypothetical protein